MIEKTQIVSKEEGFSLLLYLSHLCLVFPLKVVNFQEGQKKGSFLLKRDKDNFSLEEWMSVFKFTLPYRLQALVLGEEKTPFSFSVKLVGKSVVGGELLLELECLF